ncbi:Uma2 family endonuclease [Actinoplanes sp. M2I2]|uniref:Uma2 family endonuclease n=1 Tax=Actinoplanes sp. M2I2 TaxID=1734444 RepID=UPI0020200E6C|nr:Uma2 family endonuclease [Actinoplanes sp. M2I2]
MTAQQAGHVLWSPDPIRQRHADHLLEDILGLPEDAPRVELRDGVMIEVPSPTLEHQNIGNLLWLWFRQNAPEEFEAGTAIGVAVRIPHFWRTEQDPVHVYAYDLVNGRYEPAGDADTELVLSAPFETKLPILDITP